MSATLLFYLRLLFQTSLPARVTWRSAVDDRRAYFQHLKNPVKNVRLHSQRVSRFQSRKNSPRYFRGARKVYLLKAPDGAPVFDQVAKLLSEYHSIPLDVMNVLTYSVHYSALYITSYVSKPDSQPKQDDDLFRDYI